MGKFVEFEIGVDKIDINTDFIVGIEHPVDLGDEIYQIKVHVLGICKGDDNRPIDKRIKGKDKAWELYNDVLQKCKGDPSCES